ncbi:hypothetical protein JH06_1223 [Blastocystis sp. subtype 4]|uniref:hypothetical protein n=1 Tax=Blastocystis sp. subtype 4 TaxID=944170 RepID=UPI0007121BB7|nr:hypothetical protein JH06_1223 [Blastocystis sp. subtype 4]KNB45058.1 hypothetical protein JH06_1223 [Blastocystis sp. subtype 4]|eukprot:XP_014528501.1 hypothetical protein JH06_1223 [Blastocystis sp. subtype 4]
MSLKRDVIESEESFEKEEREEMIKRFKGKKVFSWKDVDKDAWLNSLVCTDLIQDTPFFVCKQVLNSIYTTTLGEKKDWTLDMLCQKWQQREKDIGLIIGLADPSIYYYNIDDFDDWGIIYEQTTFKDTLPSEEELVALLKTIYSFHQENPNLLIGFMDFTVSSIPFYIITQYVGRSKKLSLPMVVSSLHLDSCNY